MGSSLGGFYATHLAEVRAKAVLINPLVDPERALTPYLGPQHNPSTGEAYELTAKQLAELEALRVEHIAHPERYLLLAQAGDELLDWRQAIAFYAGAWQLIQGGGDHGYSGFGEQIPLVLRFAGVDCSRRVARPWLPIRRPRTPSRSINGARSGGRPRHSRLPPPSRRPRRRGGRRRRRRLYRIVLRACALGSGPLGDRARGRSYRPWRIGA